MNHIRLLLVGLMFLGLIQPEALSHLGQSLSKQHKKKDFYPATLADFSTLGKTFRALVMPYYEEHGEKYVLMGREINSRNKAWDLFH